MIYKSLYESIPPGPHKEVEGWFAVVIAFENALGDWSKAPPEAAWKTVTPDGVVDYWDDEPHVEGDCWTSATGAFFNTLWQAKWGRLDVPLGYDWRLTKRGR